MRARIQQWARLAAVFAAKVVAGVAIVLCLLALVGAVTNHSFRAHMGPWTLVSEGKR